MFKNMKLGTKLLLAFLAVGVIPFAVIGIMSLMKSSNALSDLAYGQLEGMRGVKKAQIESFFEERQGDMNVLVETVATLRKEAFSKLEAIQQLKKAELTDYFETMKNQLKVLKDDQYVMTALLEFEEAFEAADNQVGTRRWEALADRYDPRLTDIMHDNEWYDIFLINTEGDIVYTVSRESDLGMNIAESKLRGESMGKAFNAARTAGGDEVVLADFAPYSPSGGVPAAFMMAQMRNENTHEVAGYVAFQIPLTKINEIMLHRKGMGKTGESYLVGQDGLMRCDSYLDPQGHSVEASFENQTKVDTEAVRQALAGNQSEKVIRDYNGNPVLSCWAPLDLGSGIRWAMMSEMDVAEAFSPVDENGNEFYAKYADTYGYYDLFLVNPDGYVFYTVAKESDYQTNLVDGKYSDSNLGELIRQTLASKQYHMADFAPYAPSNNEPCAFIAQPAVYDGQVEIVVALQLSLDAINTIMQQREGMGETGETYLVGQDKLMRSDSYLDPTNHSVKASFANPNKGSVDTEAAREALSGKTDSKIITDYNGNPVLSAFAPVEVGDTTWALLAEVDESEAFAAVNMLKWLMGVIAVVGVAAIICVALIITRSITKPISRVIAELNEGSEQVASASGQVSSASQSLAEGSAEQASSLEETSSSLEEMSSMTKQNAENASQADNLMKDANQVVTKANTSMSDLTTSMEEITKASEETSKIIKTIDEIAFQTNLLALNAAVEAARAGEAGAGFAVVADEVRNLAMRAADAAKNTADLIEGTVKKVNDGSELVSGTNEAFQEVAKSATKVGELVGEIAAASNEQAQGIEQVNKAVSEMDKVVQGAAANAEESASAAEEMNGQAEQMKGSVKDLMAIVGNTDTNGHMSTQDQRKALKRVAHGAGSLVQKAALAAPGKKKTRAEGTAGQQSQPQPHQSGNAEDVIPMDDNADFKDF